LEGDPKGGVFCRQILQVRIHADCPVTRDQQRFTYLDQQSLSRKFFRAGRKNRLNHMTKRRVQFIAQLNGGGSRGARRSSLARSSANLR